MHSILDSYPEYADTAKLDELRATEYSYLDEQGHVYLDYTGSGLAARAQHQAHQDRLTSTTFGNPHSANPTSRSSTELVEEARQRVLTYLNASPEEYTVIFTANATGAARLVAESYKFRRGSKLVLTADNHNSVNGFRVYARRGHAHSVVIPLREPDLRIDTAAVAKALSRRRRGILGRCLGARGLFAYPAQSNFSGVRHPLEWVDMAQKQGYDVLLDAAAYLPTSKLDLSVVRPEFAIVSWYKLFGFPTGVGCLIARHDALARLDRPWFSGGTVEAATVGVNWHIMKGGNAGFEDGTVNFLSIPDVHFGLDWLTSIGMDVIHNRVNYLTGWFLHRIQSLRHSDGKPMVRIYGPKNNVSRGGTVCFNFIDTAGKTVDERLVDIETAAAGISIRTGCFCNPGAGEGAFHVKAPALMPLLPIKKITFQEIIRIIGLPTAGAIRVSFGLVSTANDVDRFITFAEETYRDRLTSSKGLAPRQSC